MNWYKYFTSPDLGPFGSTLSPVVQIFLQGLWWICLVWAGAYVVIGIARLASARQNNRYEEMEREKSGLVFPVISLVLLGLAPAILSAVSSI